MEDVLIVVTRMCVCVFVCSHGALEWATLETLA
jgi:hypothetical protein